MSDYYTEFCGEIPLPDEAAILYALELARKGAEALTDGEGLPEDFPAELREHTNDWLFETERSEQGVQLSTETGGVDAACLFIQHLLQRFNPNEAVGFAWWNGCTDHRPEACEGGAAFITAENIETMTTAEWLREKMATVVVRP